MDLARIWSAFTLLLLAPFLTPLSASASQEQLSFKHAYKNLRAHRRNISRLYRRMNVRANSDLGDFAHLCPYAGSFSPSSTGPVNLTVFSLAFRDLQDFYRNHSVCQRSRSRSGKDRSGKGRSGKGRSGKGGCVDVCQALQATQEAIDNMRARLVQKGQEEGGEVTAACDLKEEYSINSADKLGATLARRLRGAIKQTKKDWRKKDRRRSRGNGRGKGGRRNNRRNNNRRNNNRRNNKNKGRQAPSKA